MAQNRKMQTTTKNVDRIIMVVIIYNLVILLTTFISVTKAIEISGNCSSRSCLGTKVQYPFGFSENCEFQLDCKSNGRMFFKGYDIRSITRWKSIILNFPPNCSRSITEIRHLFGKNYALTNLNGLLLQNCAKPFIGCMIPPSLLESRLAFCGSKSENMSCYDSKNGTLEGEILRYEDVTDSRCNLLYSSIVVDSFVSGGNPDDTWLELEAVQVSWWINGECRCHEKARCIQVAGASGFRCQCDKGFIGDGFIDGEGCRNEKYFGNEESCSGDKLHLPNCQTNKSKRRHKLRFVVTLIIAVASLVGVVLSLIYILVQFRKKQNKISQGSMLNLKLPFLKVSYDMLLKATERFSKENLVGAGHFGSVYKGVLDLEHNKKVIVAVKVISLDLKGATKSFMAECEVLRNIRHRNLLRIITACSSTDFRGNDFKALVYEFMPNGNLQQWIHNNQHTENILSLVQRVSIAIDVACALDYLHNYCDIPIIHCDLKPANILLDNDMVANVGDFGLARFHSQSSSRITSSVAVKGTVGYAAPEYGLGSRVSKEGDMYSFGIVLIEMMIAQSPTSSMFEEGLDLHKYAKKALSTDRLSRVVDPRLLDDSDGAGNGNQDIISATNVCRMKCIKSLMQLGVKCSVDSPQKRIKIEDAIKELQVTKDTFLEELRIINRYMY
ncbi:receptor kinase-like protein Xa21 [Chenopodium quinoa]|uniref:receptor kinase-like protein Xa21 n=1 Tax=Chenopodium quinoa TaxID=63459 RepID=UPI000B79AAFB|nr:receptor kinase-like protein Xa21 [Chenopodium quinoa]